MSRTKKIIKKCNHSRGSHHRLSCYLCSYWGTFHANSHSIFVDADDCSLVCGADISHASCKNKIGYSDYDSCGASQYSFDSNRTYSDCPLSVRTGRTSRCMGCEDGQL